jgi:hypothetical protein
LLRYSFYLEILHVTVGTLLHVSQTALELQDLVAFKRHMLISFDIVTRADLLYERVALRDASCLVLYTINKKHISRVGTIYLLFRTETSECSSNFLLLLAQSMKLPLALSQTFDFLNTLPISLSHMKLKVDQPIM